MSDLRALGQKAANEGLNISRELRTHLGTEANTPEIIEIAYDLQAGTYIRFAEDNPEHIHAYAAQLAALLDPHLQPGDRLLDAGAGELTNLSHMVAALKTPLSGVVACDISEQRLALGRAYAEKHMGAVDLTVFRAEISSLPLPDKGVDVVTTNHALEPNGGRERELLAELLRVARRTLVLFEPCFEIATREGQERMADHGYIRDLARHAEAIGARVESVTPVELVDNRLNPTACFVISH